MKFEGLTAWWVAREQVREIYTLCRQPAVKRDWGFRDQIQRASVSVMSNLAEGFERLGQKEKNQFYHVARASNAEVRSLLFVAVDNFQGLNVDQARKHCEKSGALITGLIRSTQNRKNTQHKK